jgi:chaperonin cofactor prefoldin
MEDLMGQHEAEKEKLSVEISTLAAKMEEQISEIAALKKSSQVEDLVAQHNAEKGKLTVEISTLGARMEAQSSEMSALQENITTLQVGLFYLLAVFQIRGIFTRIRIWLWIRIRLRI